MRTFLGLQAGRGSSWTQGRDLPFAAATVLAVALAACGGGGGEPGPTDPGVPDTPGDPGSGDDGGGDIGTPDGTPCDDGDPCTRDDAVQGGECRGIPYSCSAEGMPCVTLACDGAGGCVVSEVQAGFCYLEDACWTDGEVQPEDPCHVCDPSSSQTDWSAPACDDQDPCTADTCDPGTGCVHAPADGPCEDGDPCTTGDTCSGGQCLPGSGVLDCDDGNPCTVDGCDAGQGCVHVEDAAQACDDHNPCTQEGCDPGTGCTWTPVEGTCNDEDACTLGDFCAEGVCVAGRGIPDCDDDNECTEDSCRPEVGCIHARRTGPCDDGVACTEDDQCLGGVCTGQKTAACPFCEYHDNPDANKAVVLEIGASGHPGDGLDLDGDPATCAPSTDCSGGVDNELGLLAPFVNEGLQAAVQQGVLTYVVEFEGFVADGTPFAMHFLASALADSNPDCDFQKEECDYYPLWEALDASCHPIVSFDNAVVTDSRITAGGPGYTFALQAGLIGGGHLELAVVAARFEAEVTMSPALAIRTLDGFLGGGVDKADLLQTVAQLPPDLFYPMDLAQVLDLLDQLVVNDLDTDLDGTPDAASVAIRFRTIPADIVPRW